MKIFQKGKNSMEKQMDIEYTELDSSYNTLAKALANLIKQHTKTQKKIQEIKQQLEVIYNRLEIYIKNEFYDTYCYKKQVFILDKDKIIFYKQSDMDKAKEAYDNPMRESGIKASIVFNYLKDDDMEPIDLSTRNSILNIKIDINKKNVDSLRETYPEVYNKIVELMQKKEFAKGITGIAILDDMQVPEWVKDYIDYTTIVNDNLRAFPCEAIGIDRRENDNINFTNILRF